MVKMNPKIRKIGNDVMFGFLIAAIVVLIGWYLSNKNKISFTIQAIITVCAVIIQMALYGWFW